MAHKSSYGFKGSSKSGTKAKKSKKKSGKKQTAPRKR